MKIARTLVPGDPGTKKLVDKYGTDLISVRYRYDAKQALRITTVELIEETKFWEPNPARIPGNKIVELHVAYGEIHIGRQVKAAGGQWNREKQLWEIPYREVIQLGYEDRLVDKNVHI